MKITDILQVAKRKVVGSCQLAPVASGGAAVFLLWEVIFSSVSTERFKWALVVTTLLFLASALLYYFLRLLERDKDIRLISSIEQIVRDVFAHYGGEMAKNNADKATAEDMNEIMQTIVNLAGEMRYLAVKEYIGEQKADQL